MRISKKRGAIAALALAAVSVVAAMPTAASAVEPNGSYGPFYVMGLDNAGNLVEATSSTTFAFGDYTFFSSLPYSASYDVAGEGPNFQGPANAASAFVFLAQDGHEATLVDYIGQSGSVTFDAASKKASFATFNLQDLTPIESQVELDAVKTNGGAYSIGVAFTNAANDLVRAYYGDITVTPGTGAWKWAAPAAVDPCIANPNGAGCPPIRPQTAAGVPIENAGQLDNAQQITGLVGPITGNVAELHAGAVTGFVQVWAYSTPSYLGSTTLDGTGDSISVAGLPAGSHTLILAETDGSVLGWGTFTIAAPAGDTEETDLTVDVITSGKFELNGVASLVDLGDVKRGQTSTPVNLGAFTVIDDRQALLGWNLTANVDTFVNGSATVPNSALGIAPSVTAAPTGISVEAPSVAGTANYTGGKLLAQGTAGSSTGELGTAFNAALAFKAPINAVAGTYTSTLTLTLTSK